MENENRALTASTPESEKTSHGTASVRSGVFNLANTILGAGMLGLPHAFAQCGMMMGLLLLLVFAGFSALGLYLLSAAADTAGRPANFHAVAEAARPGLGLLIDSAIAIKCFGVATSYLIVVGDSLPLAMPADAPSLLHERRLWSALAALGISPLAFLQRVDALRFTSLVALVCILIITLMVALFAWVNVGVFDPCGGDANGGSGDSEAEGGSGGGGGECRGEIVAVADGGSVLKALPIFIFAFTCHQNIISITNELHRPTRARTTSIIACAEAAALSLYVVIALCGYSTFGDNVAHDVLQSYPASAIVSVARFMIATVVAFSYPLQSHPSRGCILSIINALRQSKPSAGAASASGAVIDPHEHVDSHGHGLQTVDTTYYAVTSAFLLASLGISLAVDDLSVVLSVVGATGSTIVTYLLPGFCYFQLCVDPRSPMRRLAALQLVAGLVLMPLCLTLIFVK